MNLTGTAIDAAQTLVKGTGKLVVSLGEGIFKTLKGIVTVDPGEMGGGLQSLTLGTVTAVGRTAINTTGKVIQGMGKAAGVAGGEDDKKKWRAGIPTRWEKAWEAAQQRIKRLNISFPDS